MYVYVFIYIDIDIYLYIYLNIYIYISIYIYIQILMANSMFPVKNVKFIIPYLSQTGPCAFNEFAKQLV